MDFSSLIETIIGSGTPLLLLALIIRKAYDLLWMIMASKVAEDLLSKDYDRIGITKQGIHLVRDRYSKTAGLVKRRYIRKSDLVGRRHRVKGRLVSEDYTREASLVGLEHSHR